MTRSPNRISVVLATYNGGRFVAEQLQTILDQSRAPDELIIVDDGSSDGTLDIVRSVLSGTLPNVRIFRSPRRLGPAANFGDGIRRASGDTVVLADQDDRWCKEKLEIIEDVLSHSGALAAFSNGHLIDGQGAPLPGDLWRRAGFRGSLRRQWHRGDQFHALLRSSFVTGATMGFRSVLRDLILPIPEHTWHDQWIVTIAAAVGTVVAIPEPLIDYRVHGHNTMGLPAAGAIRRAQVRRRKADPRRAEILRFCELRDRLIEFKADDERVRAASDKVEFLQFRANLDNHWRRRIRSVLRMAFTGRYHGLASGWNSVMIDLIGSKSLTDGQ